MTRAVALCVLACGIASAAERIAYPKPKTVDQVDVYHGVKVADPYRWLENPDTAEAREWIEAENAISEPYLSAIPGRDAIKKRITDLMNYEKFGLISKRGSRYFWSRNDGLQERYVYYTSKSLNSPGEVLIDPNQFTDKTLALAGSVPSEDGKTLAYSLQRAGSEWREIAFMDIDSKRELPDRLKWVKFSGMSWSHDNKGIYYSRYDEPSEATKMQAVNYNQKLYYHRIGTPQSEDRLVLFRPENKDWMYSGGETDDGRFVIVAVSKGSDPRDLIFYRRAASQGEFKPIIAEFNAMYSPIGNDGDILYVHTTFEAPRGRVIAIDVNKPEPSNWKTIVPEGENPIQGVSYMNGMFIASYMKDARSEVRFFNKTGKPAGELELPGIGRAMGFGGRQDDTETFYMFTSYTFPTTIYRLDLKTRQSTAFKQPKVPIDLAPYETELVFYNSKDGTRVPMFLTHRKGVKRDGSTPVFLYGYGGFRSPVTPAYSPVWASWLEMGGMLAMPGLRGGNEYGDAWHKAGTKLQKQNVFDDFIAAAEYLVREKYTVPKKIAIHGGSNGGLLVAACMLQRPDLFGVVVPAVGVLDMLRFHKFTIGWGWTSDYGSPDNPEEFKALYAYSPLHNIRKGVSYPATLITTADHDDRVVPAHSFKFAAALQAAQEGPAPILIRIQTKAGHGAGKPLSMIIEEQADMFAFITKNLRMKAATAE